jgi:SAM-dependent methyltransferase
MSSPHLTVGDWHTWFEFQAGWTRQTRQWLYREAGLGQAVLDVGCGTGVILDELIHRGVKRAVGLDIDAGMVAFTRQRTTAAVCVGGDAHALPFSQHSFDVVVCHYLLLWLADPLQAVREMARVVRPGGAVLACAEPDYGGRIDHPPEMVSLGFLQAEALQKQGADPRIGRRLGELFSAAGLQTTVGVMAGRWDLAEPSDAEFEAEWAMRARDLVGLISSEELERLRAADRRAQEAGRRVLFVPTFYALGRKSGT